MQLPAKFIVQASSSKGIETIWESIAEELEPIQSSIPKEFNGPGGGYSPEDLFALAAINCIIATFKVYAEKSNLTFEKIEATAELTVDRHPSENFLSMSHINIKLEVQNASDPQRVQKTLERAAKDCAVCNSIKTGKTFEIKVS